MGSLSRFSSGRNFTSSLFEAGSTPRPSDSPNPAKWKLVREEQVGGCCVLEISYPDARNYEGRKIMVFRARGLAEIMQRNKGLIDPHFCDNRAFLSPVARFEPTADGWRIALACARML